MYINKYKYLYKYMVMLRSSLVSNGGIGFTKPAREASDEVS